MQAPELKKLNKLLVANRGEIAIRIFRAAAELRIKTVAIYTYEDRYCLHRYKADEAYQIGSNEDPLKPYLDIEAVITVAKANQVDAIHPGYGFLSENVLLARRCQEEGIIFIGPDPGAMEALGDKIAAKNVARSAGVPVIEDAQVNVLEPALALSAAEKIGYPIIIKAAAGGGGRGMRVVRNADQLLSALTEAGNEASKAFGDATVFLERFLENPKHIEVQIMGDLYGNLIHLFERDCSVQRRFQKVVEVAPAPNMHQDLKQQLYRYALAIARKVNYSCVGTVEFLVQADQIYFIEVNPRIQVEHTITEEITGIDIVRNQILISQGYPLHDRRIGLADQAAVTMNGFAIQCRITTEDPENGFKPDFGTIIAYRNAAGFGIRLDEGNAYAGARISPFFDSMLVKVSARGRSLKGACQRIHRALREFRIRGVKTNIGFLENVIVNSTFQNGECTVRFIDDNPDLFRIIRKRDTGTKLLRYVADVSINGHPDIPHPDPTRHQHFRTPKLPAVPPLSPHPDGTKQLLTTLGPAGFAGWIKDQKQILFTDTTLRDAHQSLLATRMRTVDMVGFAQSYSYHHPQLFSLEMWGGATFDVAMRFLHECPWDRLRQIREAAPNTLLQMLLRGSNAVGYSNYPDNLIERFVEQSASSGIDVFRIFDSLNWVEGIKVSLKAVTERTNSLAEASICYTGDLQDPKRIKYNLQYYIDLAKELEGLGAHILCIKDMAGLLKPYAAAELVSALKQEIQIPIHLHTHDTSSIQAATYLKAIEAGVDIVDVALAGLSGLTSQPNFNSLVAGLQGQPRLGDHNLHSLNRFSNYWEDVREWYYPFESDLKAGTAEVYTNEIPGGQYSNLRPQARSLGLENQFETIKQNYAVANALFGDIVKVTPSSKIVGDFALFLTTNQLSASEVMTKGASLSFPESVKGFFRGEIGQPTGGFPPELQAIVLKGETPMTDRPNTYLQPLDLDADMRLFGQTFPDKATPTDYLSYKMYPKVFEEYYAFWQQYGDVWHLPTTAFFFGMQDGEEALVNIGQGKSIIIRKLATDSNADAEGIRGVSFELNGQNRQLRVRDLRAQVSKASNRKTSLPSHIGSPMQGKLAQVLVQDGQAVSQNQALFVIEAMKMETTIVAPVAGKIKSVALLAGTLVEQDDLVIELLS